MKKNIANTNAWGALSAHHKALASRHMVDLFAEDGDRFQSMHFEACGLTLDYSKNRITGETLELLISGLEELSFDEAREALFRGELVNSTEQRSALHTALRYAGSGPYPTAEFDVTAVVSEVRERVFDFAEAVRCGRWLGFTGKPIRNVVNIGIGGSDLGPAMVAHALDSYASDAVRGFFVSNLDPGELQRVFRECEADETLFIVASKTFSTLETLTNARSARSWLIECLGSEQAVARHFVAVSTQTDRVVEFGIDPANMFEFWDWVGGRYSVWSAIGLSVVILIGRVHFESFLAGAAAMDEHFRETPLRRNMPVILASIGVWYRNFFETQTHAVLSYDEALRLLPDYLQQLEMESNGKHVRHDGSTTGLNTCPVVWGGLGNNAQHAFYQLLHQGTVLVPSDFLVPMQLQKPLPDHTEAVISNALAQMEALMCGRSEASVRAKLASQGGKYKASDVSLAHRVLPGNQPTNCLLYQRLTPAILGSLLALYEHKVYVQSVFWGNNPFDQWGVELGKDMAGVIAAELRGGVSQDHDGSTAGLLQMIMRSRAAES